MRGEAAIVVRCSTIVFEHTSGTSPTIFFVVRFFVEKCKSGGTCKNKVRMCYLLTSLSFTVPNVIAVKVAC